MTIQRTFLSSVLTAVLAFAAADVAADVSLRVEKLEKEKGVLQRDELAACIRKVDLLDGAADGKLDLDSLEG